MFETKMLIWDLLHEAGFIFSGVHHHGNLQNTANLLQNRFYSGLEIATQNTFSCE